MLQPGFLVGKAPNNATLPAGIRSLRRVLWRGCGGRNRSSRLGKADYFRGEKLFSSRRLGERQNRGNVAMEWELNHL